MRLPTKYRAVQADPFYPVLSQNHPRPESQFRPRRRIPPLHPEAPHLGSVPALPGPGRAPVSPCYPGIRPPPRPASRARKGRTGRNPERTHSPQSTRVNSTRSRPSATSIPPPSAPSWAARSYLTTLKSRSHPNDRRKGAAGSHFFPHCVMAREISGFPDCGGRRLRSPRGFRK